MAKTKDQLLEEARAKGVTGVDENTENKDIQAAIDAHDAGNGAEGEVGPGIASPEENAALEHSQGGVTTRDDRHDLGVPMLQGDPIEPVGPEDALGRGEKRGDYRDRVPGQPHTAVALAGGGGRVTKFVDRESGKEVDSGAKNAVEVVVDNKPTSTIVAQKPRTEEIGNDNPMLKGGVTTDPQGLATALGVDPARAGALVEEDAAR